MQTLSPPTHPCRRLVFLKALGPLTVCIISIALMNIFKWWVATHARTQPSLHIFAPKARSVARLQPPKPASALARRCQSSGCQPLVLH